MASDRRTYVRQEVERFPNPGSLHLAPGVRGAFIGDVEAAIKTAAAGIGLPVSSARDLRLRLARQTFGREIHSFSSLSDAELHGLHRWIRLGEAAISDLQDWLKANYGEQLPLI